MVTTVVNKRYEEYDVYIGRGSAFGNPFSHKAGTKAQVVVESREQAIEMYEQWIRAKPELLNLLHALKGKRLGCYCKPLSCHGDVLVKLIEEYYE